ncbi:GNAT family protein [Amycolatopsis sp.]|uniref:GNAT family N-acetyltransferase n=1 Tax=Amycolatopsis sp. TaxID=37632 RepID=UPI002C3B9E3E|nr:GNAT family protein [Amycolatopsis sp.]HVV12206.1 GNAT family protein [Amycolatopsis sp.]
MLVDRFPLVGLRLRTPRLELRLPGPEELAALGEVAAAGVHEPGVLPFRVPWTEQPPEDVARSVLQHHWRWLGAWEPARWELHLTVFRRGEPVGRQSVGAREFAITREVHTGSWLGLAHQSQGIGTEMRAAVLELAFAGLGAEEAVSSAFAGSVASYEVSRKLGYRQDGVERQVVRGELTVEHRLRLARADWRSPCEVEIEGLSACLPLFGLTS